jgi:glucose dehydrogenase
MGRLKWNSILPILLSMVALPVAPVRAQQGARNGEWRFYGGDAGTTKYTPLEEINAAHVKE